MAKLAKVSQTTVSRVLNNYPHVKKETREKVHDAIKALGFSPDGIAQSLANKRTNTIGLIVEDISNSFYAETAHIILREAQKYDYEVIIIDAESDEINFEKAINTLTSKRVDGIIVASIRMGNQKLKSYYDRGYPIILYNRRVYGLEESHYVEVDNKKGAKQAIDYLVGNYHKKIAFFSGPTMYSTFHNRYEGYKEALEEHNLDFDRDLIYEGELSYNKVFQFALNLMRKEDMPTAYFASTDQLALAILDAATRSGRHIPYDISVIGFDDIAISSSPYISLSTVSQRKEEMAVLTLKKLIACINNQENQITKMTLEPELIIRRTTGVNHQQNYHD